ncbi:prephenate dehydrogenase/arogenate dehydrogenase family protein [Lentzea sp. NPDC058436]|uniref:prephenate dehydrogenase/arogenate dehydrogenase family protein n=1 Tax=Lentzea sp. NPDC058436 TaxID=3346499 RepID=UPI003654BEC2
MTCRSAVVLGGAGQVGGLFVRLLQRHLLVTVVDRLPAPSVSTVVGDVSEPSPAALEVIGAADIIVVALPEEVALSALEACAPVLRTGVLVVDTLSVKESVASVLRAMTAARGIEALSLNPMFAPALGFRDHAVAAVPVEVGRRARWLLELITGEGARVVELSAQEHDRVTAVVQAATHASVLALGKVTAELGISIDRIVDLAPPPHRTLLALLARITGANPEVYWDVQASNRAAAAARTALAGALVDLDALVTAGGRGEFGEWLGRLGAWAAPRGEALRAQSVRQLEALNPDPRESSA